MNNLPEGVDTIRLTEDAVIDGIPVNEGQTFTLDLRGHTLDFEGEMAGSAGTKTNALQLLKDSNIVIKDGIIKSEAAKILIQNYSNLTLDNVQLLGSPKNKYVLSNNFGNIVLKNGTHIEATSGNIAFDLYYGMNNQGLYDAGVTVTIEDDSVVIDGPIEFGKANRASHEDFIANTHLYIPDGYQLAAPSGYQWVESQNPGYLELAEIGK